MQPIPAGRSNLKGCGGFAGDPGTRVGSSLPFEIVALEFE